MIGPGLPNPFEVDFTGREHTPSGRPQPDALDAAVVEALRHAPPAAPPPLLYAAVMRSVRREPRPAFQITWLDLALSLFAAGMLIALWWAWRSLPPMWVDYARLLVIYQLQKLWLLNFPLLAFTGAAAAMLVAGLAAALTYPRR